MNFGEFSHPEMASFEQSILIKGYHSHKVQLFSTPGIIAVIFLQPDGEHGVETRPSHWAQVVLVGALDQIIAQVLVLVAVLVARLIWVLAVVVHH